MRRLMNLSRSVIILGVALAAAAGAHAAEAGSAAKNKKRGPTVTKDRPQAGFKVQDGKASMDLSKAPMQDVVFNLQRATGLNIVLHPDLQAANPVITLKVNNMRLGSALYWICELAGATYVLEDEAIFIVPKNWRRKRRTTSSIDVRDMTLAIRDFPGPRLMMAQQNQGQQGVGITIISEMDPEPNRLASGDQLVELVQRSMQAKGENVSVQMRNGHLVITTGEDF